MVSTLGTRRLGVPNLTILTYLYPFNRCFRANPMPSQLEALRIAEQAKIGYQQILAGIILTIVFGIFFTFWLLSGAPSPAPGPGQACRKAKAYVWSRLHLLFTVAYFLLSAQS